MLEALKGWLVLWAPQLALLIPLVTAIIAWYVNERSKRSWEEYVRKEQHYSALLRSVRGFYASSADRNLREEFLQQLDLCWLYCPDEVIIKGYAFLDAVHEDSASNPGERDAALGNFVAQIRRDMLHRGLVTQTDLDGSRFRRLSTRTSPTDRA